MKINNKNVKWKDFIYLARLNKWFPLYLLHSIFFNFKYLPFKQAIKLPILLYRPRFLSLKGKIVISGSVKTGMIQIGFYRVPLYPDSGCILSINGNVNFDGRAFIGNDSKLIVGSNGELIIGNNFNATASLKLIANNSVKIEHNVLIGWDNLISDYDFHKLKYTDNRISKGYGSIKICHDCWLANRCSVYKNVTIPPHSVLSAGTTLKRTPTDKQYCLIGESDNNINVLYEGLWHDMLDDKIVINQQ